MTGVGLAGPSQMVRASLLGGASDVNGEAVISLHVGHGWEQDFLKQGISCAIGNSWYIGCGNTGYCQ